MGKINTAKVKRDGRTTQEQLEYFVEFCKVHPGLLKNKRYNPLSARDVEELWEKLSQYLNSMKGPTRTSEKWKITLLHWKTTVLSRDRKAKDMVLPGEAPSAMLRSALDDEAVQTFRIADLDGIEDGRCLGFSKTQVNNNDEHPPADIVPTTPTPSFLLKSPLPSPILVESPLPSPLQNVPSPSFSVPSPSSSPLESVPSPSLFLNSPSPPPLDTQSSSYSSRKVQEKRNHMLFDMTLNNSDAQKRRVELEQQKYDMLLASNLALQETMKQMTHTLFKLVEVIAKKKQ